MTKKLISLLIVISCWSCASSDVEPSTPSTPTSTVFTPSVVNTAIKSPKTVAVRDDRQFSDYIAMTTNTTPNVGDDFPDFSPVMCVTIDGDSANGTATLISSTWLLSAGHNFFEPDFKNKPVPAASKIKILVGNDASNPVRILKVAEVIIHPNWLKGDGNFGSGTDMALIRLEEAITDIKPAAVNYDVNAEKLKANIWSCGYGNYDFAKTQKFSKRPKKYATVNVLDRIVGNIKTTIEDFTSTGGLLAYDFDSPDGRFNTLGDSIVGPQEKILGTGTSAPEPLNMEGTTIGGDSGGPIFMKIDGVWKICGTLHGGVGDIIPDAVISSYGDVSVYIRTAPMADWIKSIVK